MKIKDILLLPFMIILFFLDRISLLFIFWENSYKFDKWLYKDEQILISIHRVLLFFSIISFFNLLFAI